MNVPQGNVLKHDLSITNFISVRVIPEKLLFRGNLKLTWKILLSHELRVAVLFGARDVHQ